MPPDEEHVSTAAARAAGLRVLHVTALMNTAWSGIGVYVTELARAQRELHHEPMIQCSAADAAAVIDHFRAVDPALRFHVFPVAGPTIVAFSPAGERWAASPAAGEFDVLHQHGIWPAFSRVTMRWRRTYNRPTVVAPHGALEKHALTYSSWRKRLALRAWELDNLRSASCLHATDAGEVRTFREFGLDNPVAVLPAGVPESWISASGDAARFRAAHDIQPQQRILLYLSRIHPKKGLLSLLDVLGARREDLGDWLLVIAGPAENRRYFAEVKRRIAAYGLAARVRVVGPLLGAGKRDAFAAAELFVLPTLSDNFAIVVAEALAAGVPVVTTHAALPWRVLETERCGWWAPPGNTHLAEALFTAMALPADELREMGHRGIAVVRRDYLWDQTARDTIRLYQWLRGEIDRPAFVIVD